MADQQPHSTALSTEDYKALYEMVMSPDPDVAAQGRALQRKLTDDELGQYSGFAAFQPASRTPNVENRADQSMMKVGPVDVPPEAVLMGPLQAGRAALKPALSMGGRVTAGASSLAASASPIIKYEVAKHGFQAVGIPSSVAIVLAMGVSGYKGKGKVPVGVGEAAAEAEAAAVPAGAVPSKPVALRVAKQAVKQAAPELSANPTATEIRDYLAANPKASVRAAGPAAPVARQAGVDSAEVAAEIARRKAAGASAVPAREPLVPGIAPTAGELVPPTIKPLPAGSEDVISRMQATSKPVFDEMNAAGKFGGDRSTFAGGGEDIMGRLRPKVNIPAEFSTDPGARVPPVMMPSETRLDELTRTLGRQEPPVSPLSFEDQLAAMEQGQPSFTHEGVGAMRPGELPPPGLTVGAGMSPKELLQQELLARLMSTGSFAKLTGMQ